MLRASGFALLWLVLCYAPQTRGSEPTRDDAAPRHAGSFALKERVGTIACSADGKLIAVGNGWPTFRMLEHGSRTEPEDWTPTVQILDVQTGRPGVALALVTEEEAAAFAARGRRFQSPIMALAFSPDGDLVAVGTLGGHVRLFLARTGQLVRSLDDQQARRADGQTPEDRKSPPRALGSVASLAFSPDGSLLAVCGDSVDDHSVDANGSMDLNFPITGPGRLKVWDVKTGTLRHDLVGHNQARAVAFSPDGKMLASAGSWFDGGDDGDTGVIVWNPHTGEKIRTVTIGDRKGELASGTDRDTHSVAFSPESKLLAIGSVSFRLDNFDDPGTGTVSLVDVGSGVEKWQQTAAGWAGPVVFTPGGETIAVLWGKTIRLLETATGNVRHEIRPDDLSGDERWRGLAIARQGPMLAVGRVGETGKGSVELWNIAGK